MSTRNMQAQHLLSLRTEQSEVWQSIYTQNLSCTDCRGSFHSQEQIHESMKTYVNIWET